MQQINYSEEILNEFSMFTFGFRSLSLETCFSYYNQNLCDKSKQKRTQK